MDGNPHIAVVVATLKACAQQKDLRGGSKIHVEVFQRGLLRRNIFIGNALVNLYTKCGVLVRAKQVFDELLFHDVVSWNTLITGFAQHGHGQRALDSFHRMQQEGLLPDKVTFSCTLKACASVGAAEKGSEIHAEIITNGCLEKSSVLGNALLDMYAKCGSLTKAQRVFDELLIRDVVSWNVLIAGYCQHHHGEQALECFERMKGEGLYPDVVTFGCILKACGSMRAAEKGKEVHAEIATLGLLRNGSVLGNALVDMYVKSGAFSKARVVLGELPLRNVVSWNTLIAGYSLHGQGDEALDCFECMQQEGLAPDNVTLGCILKACGSIGAGERGNEIHAEIARKGWMQFGIETGNALVDMYVKSNDLAKARDVLEELPFRDVVSWTALIAGYSHHGQGEKALNCFERMKCDGFSPDRVTFACILKACGSLGAAEKGKDLHSEIVRKGLLRKDTMLGGALVDMYANCGALDRAQEVFGELPVRDVVSYSALIAGYCEHGYGETALQCYEEMLREDLFPDVVTFSCVLKACGSLGATEQGQRYFETLTTSYGVVPTLEHFTCMVDLFGRAAHFDKAMAVIKRMPSSNHLPAWCALLGACQKWGNAKIGSMAFENALRADEKCAVA